MKTGDRYLAKSKGVPILLLVVTEISNRGIKQGNSVVSQLQPRYAFVLLLRARLITYIYPLWLEYNTQFRYISTGDK